MNERTFESLVEFQRRPMNPGTFEALVALKSFREYNYDLFEANCQLSAKELFSTPKEPEHECEDPGNPDE